MFKVKTFTDLVFTDHLNNAKGIRSTMSLGNDLQMSVVSMKKNGSQYGGLYGDASKGTYEVAVFRNDSFLPLHPLNDYLGWQTEDELNALMGSLQGSRTEVEGFIQQLHAVREDHAKGHQQRFSDSQVGAATTSK